MSKAFVCTNCGYFGKQKKITKGSTLIELILWLCFFFPGLIYSIWRLTTKHTACPKCGNQNMVPSDSPMGKKALKDLEVDESVIQETETKAQKDNDIRNVVKTVAIVLIVSFFCYLIAGPSLRSAREKAEENRQTNSATEQVTPSQN